MDNEVWAEIADFPDYAVSTHGNVMNLKTNQLLRPRNNSYGYTRVGLRKDGRTHDVYVHHLVAKTFITGYRWGTSIKHVNDNSNNHVNNLRFRRGRRMGTITKYPPKARSRRIRVVETGMVFLTVDHCARYMDGDPSSIYKVLRGDRASYRGLTFEYHYEEQ